MTRPDPDDAFEEALALHQQGELDGAEARYRALLEADPDHAGAIHYLGTAALQRGRYDLAVAYLERALALSPGDAEALDHLGLALRALGRHAEAADALQRSLALDSARGSTRSNLAMALNALGRFADAERLARSALDLDPTHAEAHLNLGVALEEQGALDLALVCFARALSHDSGLVEAHLGLARGATFQAASDPRLSRLEALAAQPHLGAAQRESVHFALGEIYDRLGAVDRAFAHFERGNASRARRHGPFDLDAHAARYVRLAGFATAPPAAAAQASARGDLPIPIFIVGMPRSGTTLVERLLSRHPEVHPGGERLFLHETATRALTEPGPVDLDALEDPARAYLGAAETRFVTDKLPHNYEHLWLLPALFPRARVVRCVRDPADTCLSCYFRAFAEAHPWANDLATLGRYHRLHERLMEAWAEALPIDVVEVVYEELVTEPEAHARRLFEALDLGWSPAWLELGDDGHRFRSLDTARRRERAIDATSVAKARRYHAHIGPLLQALGGDRGA